MPTGRLIPPGSRFPHPAQARILLLSVLRLMQRHLMKMSNTIAPFQQLHSLQFSAAPLFAMSIILSEEVYQLGREDDALSNQISPAGRGYVRPPGRCIAQVSPVMGWQPVASPTLCCQTGVCVSMVRLQCQSSGPSWKARAFGASL